MFNGRYLQKTIRLFGELADKETEVWWIFGVLYSIGYKILYICFLFLWVSPLIILSCICLQIERTLFEDTVKTLNNYYAEAEKIGGQSYLEGCLACATAYLIFLCMETRYEKVRLTGSNLMHFNGPGLSISSLTCSVCVTGVEEDSQVHSGAEREDLRSQRSAHHRSHRKGNACCILTQSWMREHQSIIYLFCFIRHTLIEGYWSLTTFTR